MRVHELRTPRLRLCNWTDDDLEPFRRLNADREAMRYFPVPYDRERSDAEAARIRERLAEHGYGVWAVRATDVAPFVGFVGLSEPTFDAPFTPCVEIGWRLGREHFGKGYATEAARAALAFGFDTLGLPEIVSFTAVENAPSRAVMERIGMTRDLAGDFDHPRIAPGHPLRRHVLYRIGRPG